MGTVIAPRTKQCATTAKTSEWERAGPNPGGPGGLPPALFLPISREKWGPRRAGGPPGALRPEAPEKPRPPEGYAVPYRSPARDRAGTHVAGSNLQRSRRDHLPTAEAPGPTWETPQAPPCGGPEGTPSLPKRTPSRWAAWGPFHVCCTVVAGGAGTLTPGPRQSGGPCWPAPGRPRRSRPRRRRPPGSPSGSEGGCPRRRRG